MIDQQTVYRGTNIFITNTQFDALNTRTVHAVLNRRYSSINITATTTCSRKKCYHKHLIGKETLLFNK